MTNQHVKKETAVVQQPQQSRAAHDFVQDMLSHAEAFKTLPAPDRERMKTGLARVMSFLTDDNAGLQPNAPVATVLEDANTALKDRLAQKQNLVGKDFKAGAATEGAKVFKQLVDAVDFPKFVSRLIEGVYTSIVDSSIKQMKEYGKFLEAVVKSVEQFANDHVSPDQARQYVANRYPSAVRLDQTDEGNRLVMKDDVDDKDLPDFKAGLGMQENVPLDEDNEAKIMAAAQLQMARQRQQQLATMVLMGINRIVVTEGEIKASVMFDVKAHDTAQRDTFANTADATTDVQVDESGGWFSDDSSHIQTKVSTAYSEAKDKSTADLEAKAKMTGSVTVKFKSETFPLERLASQTEMGALNEKSVR